MKKWVNKWGRGCADKSGCASGEVGVLVKKWVHGGGVSGQVGRWGSRWVVGKWVSGGVCLNVGVDGRVGEWIHGHWSGLAFGGMFGQMGLCVDGGRSE